MKKWDGTYIKEIYIVKTKDNELVECWPNAGHLHALDGSGRIFEVEDNVEVELKNAPNFW